MGLTTRGAQLVHDVVNERQVPDCSFCAIANEEQDAVVVENDGVFAIYDKYPVNPGHTLLIPKRHVLNVFELTPEEWLSLHRLLAVAKAELDVRYQPSGFNIGINWGVTAGQTVPHLHVHLIPRFEGDVPNPRGGIRNFKPPVVPYQ